MILSKNKKILCFDLDNVLCKTIGNNYKNSTPLKKNIYVVNKLYKKGNYIKIFTARYMGRNKDSIAKAKKQAKNLTLKQLKKWKVCYHKLIFGKPSYDIFIDDKNLFFKKDWPKYLEKKIK